MINQITRCEHCISLKTQWDVFLCENSVCSLNYMPIFSSLEPQLVVQCKDKVSNEEFHGKT